MSFLSNLFGGGKKSKPPPSPPKTTDTAIQDATKRAQDQIRLARGRSSTFLSTDLGHVG